VKPVRFVQLILGLLVIIFALVTGQTWGRFVIGLLGLLLVILSFTGVGGQRPAPKPEKKSEQVKPEP